MSFSRCLNIGIERRRAPGNDRTGRHRAHLGAMAADRRQLQRRKEFVHLGDRAGR